MRAGGVQKEFKRGSKVSLSSIGGCRRFFIGTIASRVFRGTRLAGAVVRVVALLGVVIVIRKRLILKNLTRFEF